MTVKDAIYNKEYRKGKTIDRTEAYQKYQEKPKGYVTLTYALDHGKIPNSETDLDFRTFICPSSINHHIMKRNDTVNIYKYIPWDNLRNMDDKELKEYQSIRLQQRQYFDQKYSQTSTPVKAYSAATINRNNVEELDDFSRPIDPEYRERESHLRHDVIIDTDYREI